MKIPGKVVMGVVIMQCVPKIFGALRGHLCDRIAFWFVFIPLRVVYWWIVGGGGSGCMARPQYFVVPLATPLVTKAYPRSDTRQIQRYMYIFNL